jgi:hypothetical protein
MNTRRLLGLAGAMTLALGGSVALANTVELGKVPAAATHIYAMESLSSSKTVGGNAYYELMGTDSGWMVTASLPDLSAANIQTDEDLFVTYTLANMVLMPAAGTTGQPSLVITSSDGNPATAIAPRTTAIVGDTTIRFPIMFSAINAAAEVDAGPPVVTTTVSLGLSLGATVGVLPTGENASITMTVTRQDVDDPAPIAKASHAAAVRVEKALSATRTKPATGEGPMASVANGYMKFVAPEEDVLMEDVGSVAFGVRMMGAGGAMIMPLAADDSVAAELSDLINPGRVDATTAPLATESQVVMRGDFSFASKVTLDPEASCDHPRAADLLQRAAVVAGTTAGAVSDTGALKPVSVAYANGKTLCIHVDGMMEIPATGAYTASVDYFSNNTFRPKPKTLVLGSIGQNGTVVDIPYLTLHSAYNQRVVIVNRNETMDANYEFKLVSEVGVNAMAGPGATGMVMAGTAKTINVRNDEVMTLTGTSPRAAATLRVDGLPSDISVAVHQVNANNGSIDTVYAHP